jgi:hypothetical protein
MRIFHVTVRTPGCLTQYTALAQSAGEAGEHAAARVGDAPCSITVMPRRTS